MQQCGFCSMMSGLLRRAMCIGSRRGSTESYYRELGDQDTLKIEDKSSEFSSGSDELSQEQDEPGISSEAEIFEMSMINPIPCTGRFLTMHKRRKKRLITKSLVKESGLLDDLLPGQVQCILDRSVQWNFNAFTLETVSGGRCLPVLCIHLFHIYGLIPYFDLDVLKVWRLFTLIEEGYHSTNPYHNSIHAVDVAQAMHCFLQQRQIRDHLEPLEVMSSLIAAIAHDVDHPGVNQPFLIATSNHLATLYKNTSVLENHHWRMAVSCLLESGLTRHVPTLQLELERQIGSLILATDITRQQEYLSQFKAYLDTSTLDLTKSEHRLLVLQIALKCADISNPCRPWEISRKWSLKVCDEFFRQGDYERKLNLPVTALCDRHTISIPKIQTGFFKFVVAPLIAEWHRFLHNELSSQMSQNLLYNQCKWEMLLAQELAEETYTEISDAELVEDDLDTSPGVDISESAEQLLPLRRGSFNPPQVASDNSKDHLRRFSVPLNVFQDTKFKNRERDSRAESPAIPIAAYSDHSLHSQLSLGEQCDHAATAAETVRLSTECLRPDSSIASITTPRQATRLSSVLKDGPGWKLIRQQTFPPLEATPRPRPAARHVSDEDAIYPSQQRTKTEYGQNFTGAASSGLSNMYKKNDSDKTDNEDASENKVDIGECSSNLKKEDLDSAAGGGRRGSAPESGALLRHNLSASDLRAAGAAADAAAAASAGPEGEGGAPPPPPPHPHQLRRRKSMPTEMLSTGKERWSKRRGSAPAPVESSQLRGLASLAAARLGVTGARRKPNPITSCQQWLAKTTYTTVQERTTQLPRRSSLPVESPQRSEVTKPSETE